MLLINENLPNQAFSLSGGKVIKSDQHGRIEVPDEVAQSFLVSGFRAVEEQQKVATREQPKAAPQVEVEADTSEEKAKEEVKSEESSEPVEAHTEGEQRRKWRRRQ